MSAITYIRLEVLRTLRNRLFFIFSLVFPLILYFLIVGTNQHTRIEGASFALYYMTGMISFGTMSAVIAGGSRIALERQVGWTRQLRITPLSTADYLSAKLATSYMMALISLVLIGLAGVSEGVSLGAGEWLLMAGLVLIGLIPFAVLGIALGNLLSADTMSPAIGGLTSLLAIIGGSFGPLTNTGVLHQIAELVPSYWITQAGAAALGGGVWPLKGFVVVAVWAAVLARAAVFAYRRSATRA